ncbi:MAG: FAD-dependent thymidylate synthase [Oscillospiraceae bacterium]|jgi:thymidylate synthase (FAD)|nr:FAD-dependent thymidylate synthase [Oscillospiraceae bacterium]
MPTVTLITHTPEPEKVVAAAAKLCYSKSGVQTLLDKLDEQKTADFLEMLSGLGHESPIEHITFTFGIEGVSRAFLAQITRHRIASYSVQSQRYVSKADFPYITPPSIQGIPEAEALLREAMNACNEYYERLQTILTEAHTARLTAEGEDEKEARRAASKLANEDARFVLPNACDTRMVVTMNARSLQNFFRLRCCNRAQWEIREVAKQMYALVYPIAPHIFAHSGPGCLGGACTEGKMSCGRMDEVRAEYRRIQSEAVKSK